MNDWRKEWKIFWWKRLHLGWRGVVVFLLGLAIYAPFFWVDGWWPIALVGALVMAFGFAAIRRYAYHQD